MESTDSMMNRSGTIDSILSMVALRAAAQTSVRSSLYLHKLLQPTPGNLLSSVINDTSLQLTHHSPQVYSRPNDVGRAKSDSATRETGLW